MTPPSVRARRGAALAGTIVVLASVVLAGCTADAPEPSPARTAGTSGAVSVPPGPGPEPTASYLEELDGWWEMVLSMHPEAERPETRIIRYISPEEWGSAIAACMTDQGFPTNENGDGGVRPAPVPVAQREALSVAQFVCLASYPVEDKYRIPLSEAQLSRLYDYLVGDLVSCLQERGFDVDASRAPSKQTFIESYNKPGAPAQWSPYEVVVNSNLSEQEWDDTQKACPQSPGDLYG